jgi:hypothetical protein
VNLGTLSLGGQTYVNEAPDAGEDPPEDAFVAKLDPAGALVWSRVFEGDGRQEIEGLSVDSCGNVLVTGQFTGSIDLGDGERSSTDESLDGFVAVYAP